MEDKVEVLLGDPAQITCMFKSDDFGGSGGMTIEWHYVSVIKPFTLDTQRAMTRCPNMHTDVCEPAGKEFKRQSTNLQPGQPSKHRGEKHSLL